MHTMRGQWIHKLVCPRRACHVHDMYREPVTSPATRHRVLPTNDVTVETPSRGEMSRVPEVAKFGNK